VKDIPEEAFRKVLISKLPKQLRKRVVRHGLKLEEATQEILKRVLKDSPEFMEAYAKRGKDIFDWGRILKSVLEEEGFKGGSKEI
jgi:hypothetical protein